MYSDTAIFKSKLFNSFYRKMLSNNTSSKIQKSFLMKLLNRFNPVKLIVPQGVNLIYKGYDRHVLFAMRDDKVEHIYYTNDVNNIYEEYPANITEKTFFGYPVYIDNVKEFKQNYKTIETFLINHYNELKNKKRLLHGNMTHLNILIKNDKISLIDENIICNTSIITDHFYFYAYLIEFIEKHKPLDSETLLVVKRNLSKLYFKLFNKLDITSELARINFEDLHLRNEDKRVQEFKDMFNFPVDLK